MTGDQIKKLRERLGLTHKEFAEFFGVSLSTAYRWEYVDEPRVDPCHARLLGVLKSFRRGKDTMARWRDMLRDGDGLSATLLVLRTSATDDGYVRR